MAINLRKTLLSTASVGALMALQTEAATAQMYTSGPGFHLSLEGRYLMNAGGRVPVWDQDAVTTNTGNQKSRADDGWGGKAMIGYRFSNNWDIALAAAMGRLRGDTERGDAVLFSSPTLPEFPTENKTKLDYHIADFEVGYTWQMGKSNLRLFGGARYAHFEQKARSQFFSFATTSIVTIGNRESKFSGIGPRIGLNGQFALGAGGFHVFGGVAGAAVIGKFKEDHQMVVPASTGSILASGSVRAKSKTKVVPNLEGELGIGYEFRSGGTTLALRAGYRADAWWGVSSKAAPISDAVIPLVPPVAPIFIDKRSDSSNQIFHGPFLRLTATFGPAAMAAVAPQPPPAPAAAPKKNFLVFFDFDRSNITADAQKVITEAATAAKAGNVSRIQLTGHTDRSGSDQYNMALSLRRGEAVKQALIRLGIPAASIAVIGRGESQPLVPTADGVREPQNRRVEILL